MLGCPVIFRSICAWRRWGHLTLGPSVSKFHAMPLDYLCCVSFVKVCASFSFSESLAASYILLILRVAAMDTSCVGVFCRSLNLPRCASLSHEAVFDGRRWTSDTGEHRFASLPVLTRLSLLWFVVFCPNSSAAAATGYIFAISRAGREII